MLKIFIYLMMIVFCSLQCLAFDSSKKVNKSLLISIDDFSGELSSNEISEIAVVNSDIFIPFVLRENNELKLLKANKDGFKIFSSGLFPSKCLQDIKIKADGQSNIYMAGLVGDSKTGTITVFKKDRFLEKPLKSLPLTDMVDLALLDDGDPLLLYRVSEEKGLIDVSLYNIKENKTEPFSLHRGILAGKRAWYPKMVVNNKNDILIAFVNAYPKNEKNTKEWTIRIVKKEKESWKFLKDFSSVNAIESKINFLNESKDGAVFVGYEYNIPGKGVVFTLIRLKDALWKTILVSDTKIFFAPNKNGDFFIGNRDNNNNELFNIYRYSSELEKIGNIDVEQDSKLVIVSSIESELILIELKTIPQNKKKINIFKITK